MDRLLFQEICHALDLDWTAVVASPDLDELESGETEANATQAAIATPPPSDRDRLLKAVRKARSPAKP